MASLKAIRRHNFVPNLRDIYNPCRVFGLYDEAGTVIATWPDDETKPAVPVPYAQETMHGMEYAFAQMLMQYGMIEEGIEVTAAVRDRYDGAKRNPWNEIECGSNYARSMASWGAVVILAGFSFDAGRGYIGFDPKVRMGDIFRSVWSGPQAWGTVEIGEGRMLLTVLGGTLVLASLGLPGERADATERLAQRSAAGLRGGRQGTAHSAPCGWARATASWSTAPSISIAGLPDVSRL